MHLTFQDMMFLKSRFFVWNVYVLSNLGLNQDAYEKNMLYIRKKNQRLAYQSQETWRIGLENRHAYRKILSVTTTESRTYELISQQSKESRTLACTTLLFPMEDPVNCDSKKNYGKIRAPFY